MKSGRVLGPIEKGIKLPPASGGKEQYGWGQLEIDDSRLISCPNSERKRLWNTLSSCRNNAQRRYPGWKFCLRFDKKGIRIWRVK